MENSISYKIWQECEQTIPFGVINGFFSEIQKDKPHLRIDKLQFLKFSHHSHEEIKIDYSTYRVGDYLQPSGLVNHDYEDIVYLQGFDEAKASVLQKPNHNQGAKSFVQKCKIVKWAYFKAFDLHSQIFKTIKVQFLEIRPRNISRFQDVLDQFKEKIISLERREMLLQIYDYYFLSEIGEEYPQYFVVEQEVVEEIHGNYLAADRFGMSCKPKEEQNREIHRFQQKCLEYCLKQLGVYHEFKRVDQASMIARFYIVPLNSNLEKEEEEQIAENQYQIKLSPLDFFPYLAVLEGTSQSLEEQNYDFVKIKDEERQNINKNEELFLKLNDQLISLQFAFK